MMKLSIANPAAGTQKVVELEYNAASKFFEKRLGEFVDGELISPEWSGAQLKITGGYDKQGFAMKHGVFTPGRVRLLLKKGDKGFICTRDGLRKRKSVRGCIVSAEVRILHLVLTKKGDNEIEGLTDRTVPLRYGPKRASKIRRLFNLSPEEDVTKYVITHEKTLKSGKVIKIAPKVQRLVTPEVIRERELRKEDRLKRKTESRRKLREYYAMLDQRGIPH